MRFPGSTRSRFVAILILALALLIADAARRNWTTRQSSETKSQDSSRPRSSGPARVEPVPLLIEALGREFRWLYRLPGHDGRLDTPDDRESVGELHVPLDTPVRLLVRSSDYVYAYSVPGLELRRIAVPELTYPLEFLPRRQACYDVVADPMCRVRPLHEEAMGHVVVEDRDAYLAWLDTLPMRRDAALTTDPAIIELR